MKIKLVIGVITMSVLFFLASAPTVRAGCCCADPAIPGTCSPAAEALICESPRVYSSTDCGGGTAGKPAGFGSASDFAKEAAGASGVDTKSTLESKVASIVNYALSLLGIVFLLLMVYGGYIWMMARGEEGEAKRAKDIITMGVIGLAIVIAAYAITFFVVQRLIAGAA